MSEGQQQPPKRMKSSSEQSESVKVSVRVRPFNARETDGVVKDVSVAADQQNAQIKLCPPKSRERKEAVNTFLFDSVFWSLDSPDESGSPPAGQVEVYEKIGKPLVHHAFSGFNSCLFAYGQTGSGKTYTMMGGDPTALDGIDAGVIPRLCLELFQTRARIEAEGHSKWMVEVGYVEVYNERVSDLLAKRKKNAKNDEVFVEVREHPTKGVFIEGQQFRVVANLEDVVNLIEAGNRVRHTAATKMNDRSSRSHAVFMLMLREERSMQTATGQTITTAGKNSRMNLVDLAGSERVAQSEVVGQQFSEARYINLSLTTLGRVIDMLADMAKNENSQWSMPPYRESKLTFILKDSLGGNSKTFMIATVSPSAINYDETLSTLRYASRARDIVNLTKVNEDPRARRIRELEEQMEQMRKDMHSKDPAYVAELEEKLILMEAEVQKRAADLQALEREREKNEVREKMLHATEAERQELIGRASKLEQQVDEARRQADYHEKMCQRLKEEHAHNERELLEQMRRREVEMESMRRHRDADVQNGQEQLRKMMTDLEGERREREEALRSLGERQEQLNAALSDSRQSTEQRMELQRQNDELASRMRQLEAERDTQKRLLSDLERFRDERQELELANGLLRTELDELEKRYDDTVYHLLSFVDLVTSWGDSLATRLGVEYDVRIDRTERCFADELADTLKRHAQELQASEDALLDANQSLITLQQKITLSEKEENELRLKLDDAMKQVSGATAELKHYKDLTAKIDQARSDVEQSLLAVTAERDELQQRLEATSDELAGKLKAAELAKTDIEQSLNAMTAERDELQQRLEATSDELTSKLKAAELAKTGVEQSLNAMTAERDELQQRLEATSDELTSKLKAAELAKTDVEQSLNVMTAERDELQQRLEATSDELTSKLKAAELAKTDIEQSLNAMTAERDELQQRLEATSDELTSKLKAAELAKTGVEQSLNAMTAERDELQQRLEATSDELSGKLKAAELAKTGVEQSLNAMTAERDELQQRLEATSDELTSKLKAAELAKTDVEQSLNVMTAERDELQQRLEATSDELTSKLKAAELAKTDIEQSLNAMTAERDELQQRLEATSDELTSKLKAAELAKTGVEQSLNAMTAERDELQQRLEATSDELSGKLKAAELAKTGVVQSLNVMTAERDELQQRLEATSDELSNKLKAAELAKADAEVALRVSEGICMSLRQEVSDKVELYSFAMKRVSVLDDLRRKLECDLHNAQRDVLTLKERLQEARRRAIYGV